jgi:outer membrane protein TolC
MMITVTPTERLTQIAKARAEWEPLQAEADRARQRLMYQINRALDEHEALPDEEKRKLGPSAIGRAAGFTREYIAQIRSKKQ